MPFNPNPESNAFNTQEPEVEGHAFGSGPASDAASDTAFAVPPAEQDPEAEGHMFSSSDGASDTAWNTANDPAFGTSYATETEPEVEGHVHPVIAPDYARMRTEEYEARGARARLVREAGGRTQDGGLLDKILRRKEK